MVFQGRIRAVEKRLKFARLGFERFFLRAQALDPRHDLAAFGIEVLAGGFKLPHLPALKLQFCIVLRNLALQALKRDLSVFDQTLRLSHLDLEILDSQLGRLKSAAALDFGDLEIFHSRLGVDDAILEFEKFLAANQHLLAEKLFLVVFVEPRLLRLPFERRELTLDLGDDVVDAKKVQASRFDLAQRFFFARLEFHDTRGFLDQNAAIFGLGRNNLGDLALLDDGVRLGTRARVHEQLVHVFQAARLAVDEVLARGVAKEAARHRDFVVFHVGRKIAD